MRCYSISIPSLAPLLSVTARVRHPAPAHAIHANSPLDARDVVAAYHDVVTRRSLSTTGDATLAEQVDAWTRWLAVLLQHVQPSYPSTLESSAVHQRIAQLEAQQCELQSELREIRACISRPDISYHSLRLVKRQRGLGPGLPGMTALPLSIDVAVGAEIPLPRTLPELLAMTRYEMHVLSARLQDAFGVVATDDDATCRDKLFQFLLRVSLSSR
ncbi:hypothetical protein PINS_up013374 [Pythium insidiosum]|nr:hypothetical protein PINS_up013374 [Pythium insidiosum]